MALQLSTPNPFDGVAEECYYKIIETNINYLYNTAHVSMGGWLDKASRDDGKNPIISESFDWSGDEFPFNISVLNEEDKNTISVSYEKIKESKPKTETVNGEVVEVVPFEETNKWAAAANV